MEALTGSAQVGESPAAGGAKARDVGWGVRPGPYGHADLFMHEPGVLYSLQVVGA